MSTAVFSLNNYLKLYDSYLLRSYIVPYYDKEEYIRFLTRIYIHHGYLRGSIKKISAFLTQKVVYLTDDNTLKIKVDSFLKELDYLTKQFYIIINSFIFDYVTVIYLPKQTIEMSCPNCKKTYLIDRNYPYSFTLQFLEDMYHSESDIRNDPEIPKDEKALHPKPIGIKSTCINCGTEYVQEPKISWNFSEPGIIKILNPLHVDVYVNDAGKKYVRLTPDWYYGHLAMNEPLRFFHIEGLTWDLISMFAGKDRYFMPLPEFYEVFSMEEISSMAQGISVSSILSSLSDLIHIDLIKLGNEGISLSKINPLYMLSPIDSSGGGAFGAIGQDEFRDFIVQEVKEYQEGDINRMIYSPIPITATPLFGDAKRFMGLQELLAFQTGVISALGFSPEVLNGTTGIFNEPFNLKSLEIILDNIQKKYFRFLDNILKVSIPEYKAVSIKNREYANVFTFEKISMAKGSMDYNLKLQLAQSNLLPIENIVEDLGYPDINYWQKKIRQENLIKYKEQKVLESEMSKIDRNFYLEQVSQSAATGTIDTTTAKKAIIAEAEQIAMQISQMPYEQRKSYLVQLQKEDPVLYSVTLTKMRDLRNLQEAQTKENQNNIGEMQ